MKNCRYREVLYLPTSRNVMSEVTHILDAIAAGDSGPPLNCCRLSMTNYAALPRRMAAGKAGPDAQRHSFGA